MVFIKNHFILLKTAYASENNPKRNFNNRTNLDPLLTFFKIDTQQIVSKIFKCENGENPSDTKNCEICDKHTIEQANQKFLRLHTINIDTSRIK